MAQLTYESLAEVPEDLQEAAKEADGKYVVNVVTSAKIKEFRDNNISVTKERDALQAAIAQYENVTGVPLPDLDEGKLSDFAKTLEALRDTKKKVDDGALVENTSLEEAAAARVTDLTNSFKEQLAQMAKDRDAHRSRADAADQRANSMMVENAVRLAASDPDVAMIDKAVQMILPSALATFKVDEDGKISPRAKDGTILYSNHDGITPKSVKEWLTEQREENDFLFKGSKGGGAAGSSDTTTGRLSAAEIAQMKPADRLKYARENGLA